MSILPVCVYVCAPCMKCWRRPGEDNRMLEHVSCRVGAGIWTGVLWREARVPNNWSISQCPQNILKIKRGLGGDSVSKEGCHQTWDVSWVLGIHMVGGENRLSQVVLCPPYTHARMQTQSHLHKQTSLKAKRKNWKHRCSPDVWWWFFGDWDLANGLAIGIHSIWSNRLTIGIHSTGLVIDIKNCELSTTAHVTVSSFHHHLLTFETRV